MTEKQNRVNRRSFLKAASAAGVAALVTAKNRLLTADYSALEARCPQHIDIARRIAETIAGLT